MSITYTFRSVVTPGSGSTAVDKSVDVTGDGDERVSASIPIGANAPVSIACPLAQMKGYIITSDITLTLKTNDSGTPDDTITLTAGIPLVWYNGCGYAKHFTADLDSLFVTNAGSGAAALEIRMLKDATP